jgi:hypothetical protein
MRPLWDSDGVLQIRIGGIEECKCLLTRKKETVTYEPMLFFGYFFRLAGSWVNGLKSECVWHGIIVIWVSPQQQPRNTRSGARCSRRKSAVRTASHRLSHRNFISGERWEFSSIRFHIEVEVAWPQRVSGTVLQFVFSGDIRPIEKWSTWWRTLCVMRSPSINNCL